MKVNVKIYTYNTFLMMFMPLAQVRGYVQSVTGSATRNGRNLSAKIMMVQLYVKNAHTQL